MTTKNTDNENLVAPMSVEVPLEQTGVANREEFLSYLNTGNSTTPAYKLLGEGFTEITESLNPKTKEKQYVHQKNASNDVTGYAPEMSFTAEVIKDDPSCTYIAAIGRERKTGGKCVTDIVNVLSWLPGKKSGEMLAFKQTTAIKVDNAGSGPSGESLALTGSFMYKGDPIQGSFNTSTLTFTADTEVSA